jgi:hypothetical protein
MTATIRRPPEVRQPYYRRFATRTALWTAVITTALVAGQYVPLLFGLDGVAGLVVGAPVAIAAGILAHAAVAGRQRWAVVLTCLMWVSWLVVGYSVSGVHNLVTLAQALAFNAGVVGCWIGGRDIGQQRRSAR